MALALVVYSEHLRYNFKVDEGGEGYKQESTSVFVLDKDTASALNDSSNLDLFEGVSLSHARAEIKGGAIVALLKDGRCQYDSRKNTSQDAATLRADLHKKDKVVVILGEGKGAVAQASLVGISTRVRDQFLFLIFRDSAFNTAG